MSLKIIGLTKRFEEKLIFDGLSVEFSDSGLYAVTGESGIGKTTLLRIIAGLDRDYSGQVIGGGAGRVSMAFQEYRLFPEISALNNLVFAISDGKNEAVVEKCKNMLTSLGFSNADIQLLPSELSGGMKQRVSIARSLLFDAPILLLDEPTKELDRVNADKVLSLILEESRHRLVILVSHNEEELSSLNPIRISL